MHSHVCIRHYRQRIECTVMLSHVCSMATIMPTRAVLSCSTKMLYLFPKIEHLCSTASARYIWRVSKRNETIFPAPPPDSRLKDTLLTPAELRADRITFIGIFLGLWAALSSTAYAVCSCGGTWYARMVKTQSFACFLSLSSGWMMMMRKSGIISHKWISTTLQRSINKPMLVVATSLVCARAREM